MFPPLPEEEARLFCIKTAEEIKKGNLILSQPLRKSLVRSQNEVMLGCLVCRDRNGKKINLITTSGTSRSLSFANADEENFSEGERTIIVPPIVSPEKIDLALKKNDEEIHLLTKKINELKKLRTDSRTPLKEEAELLEKRKALTTESLLKFHELYSFKCIDGKTLSLSEIFNGKNPPTGTGECCAPKLFHFAFSNNLIPLSLCEILFPNDPSFTAVPPCDERCAPLLNKMLGLRILYRDRDIIVVNKESGILSVPGRGPEKLDSVSYRVRRLFPDCIEQPAVHRLDMETSGLMVLALNKESHRELNRQFEKRETEKEYLALLDGNAIKKGIAPHGKMELFFRLDVENRPHQIWDNVYGKSAVTEWEILGVEKYKSPAGKITEATRVRFIPHTGRTHQLRLASADSHGFGIPIIGDSLYGTCLPGERLLLHAAKLSFTHPTTGERMCFESRTEF